MEFRNYFAAIKRRWQYLAASVAIICGIVGFHVLTTDPPAMYEAQSKIFVSANTTDITADDIAQMAVSNNVADQCIRSLNLGWRVNDLLTFVRADVGGGTANRSNVVNIHVYMPTADKAVEIANRIADLAKDRAIDLTQLGTFHQGDYIVTQRDAARRRLDKAEAALKDFKQANKSLLVPLDFADAKRMIYELDEQAAKAEAQVDENQSRVSRLKRDLARRTSAKVDVASAPSNARIDALNAAMAQKDIALSEAQIKYSDAHPTVKNLKSEIESIKSRLQDEYKKTYTIGNAPSSLEYQFVVGDITRFEAESAAARSRKAAIARLASRATTQLAQVPELEVRYARLNTEARAAQDQYMDLQNRYDQAMLAVHIASKQHEQKEGIGMIDYASGADLTPGAKFQKPAFKLGIAFLISLILGVGIILFLEGMDTSIRDVDQMEDRYQLPVLGVIPTLREAALKSGSTLVLRDSPDSPFAEPYRIMRTNFMALAAQAGARSVLITSTLPGEGKSTTAANFASSLAEGHKKVILLDADMRNPTLHRTFGIRKEPGLSNYLKGEATLDEIIFPTNIDNLLLISAGPIPDNPSRLITSHRMRELLECIGATADYVVVDTPPAVAFSDAMELASIVDSMIVVVGAGSRLESAHFRARTQLANANAVLVGTVLNRVQTQEVDSYRYSSQYYPRLNGALNGNGHRKHGKVPDALPGGDAETTKTSPTGAS